MDTFKEELAIDHNALDIEWIEQPKRFYDIAEQFAEAKRAVEQTKLAQEVVEATMDNAIRTNPAEYGIAKITEGAIKSALIVSKEYQDAVNRHIDAKYTCNMMQNAVTAWGEQRKAALEGMVKLHGQNYFAGPSVPRDLEAQFAKRVNTANVRGKTVAALNDKGE